MFGEAAGAVNVTESRVVDCETGLDVGPGERAERLVRTPAAMRSYLDNPEATADTVDPDGWVTPATSSLPTPTAGSVSSIGSRTSSSIRTTRWRELEGILVSPDAVFSQQGNPAQTMRPGPPAEG